MTPEFLQRYSWVCLTVWPVVFTNALSFISVSYQFSNILLLLSVSWISRYHWRVEITTKAAHENTEETDLFLENINIETKAK